MEDKVIKIQKPVTYSELGWHYSRKCHKCNAAYGVWYPDIHSEDDIPETIHNCKTGGYDYVR